MYYSVKQCSPEWLLLLGLPEVPLVNLINPHLGFGKKINIFLLCTVNLIIMGML